MTKTITILGSTGSIGRQTLSVADELGLRVAALTAERNVELLEAQCRQYRPELAVLADEAAAEELKVRLADMNIRVLAGAEALCEAAALPEADTVVVAVCGFAALRPTLTAIHAKKRIALANKETMVCAGEIMQSAARESGAEIIPVDSEHSAIFQCLMGCRDRAEVKRLILTCSGGPFFGKTRESLACMTKSDALRHPNWKMGAKITVDCATLMNKGLEIIEAMRLYDLPLSKVTAVIHRQSVVHSLVEFVDGAVLAQLGNHKNLGIHTEMFSDGVIDLVESGVVNGSKKTLHPGKLVATFLMGTRRLYDFVDKNACVEMRPVDYVNDPRVIAQNEKMVSINSCIEVDLMGQVASETIGLKQFSGTGGQVDYVRGAAWSAGGKSIMAMPSTAAKGKASRIVPFLAQGAAVTTSRNDVDYVVTEYGIARLKGKTLKQRARALIAVAHPDFRPMLEEEYQKRFKD